MICIMLYYIFTNFISSDCFSFTFYISKQCWLPFLAIQNCIEKCSSERQILYFERMFSWWLLNRNIPIKKSFLFVWFTTKPHDISRQLLVQIIKDTVQVHSHIASRIYKWFHFICEWLITRDYIILTQVSYHVQAYGHTSYDHQT